MNKEKMIVKCLILLNLLKNDDSSNLGIVKKLRNLIMCCIGLKMAAQDTAVPFPLPFPFCLVHNHPTLRDFVNNPG